VSKKPEQETADRTNLNENKMAEGSLSSATTLLRRETVCVAVKAVIKKKQFCVDKVCLGLC